jgi:nicotinate-nucleotide adenylyltransferase
MRILVLGGTFNPIHIGHLMLAEEVAAEFGYGRVILVPSLLPPHKRLEGDPGSGSRLAMVQLAVAGNPLYAVSACELERGGISYTVDTLAHLIDEHSPDGKPGLLIGDDLARGFLSWRDPQGILKQADLIVAGRTGDGSGPGFPHRRAGNMLLPISSTDIRRRIAQGKPWKWLVPAPCARYIEEHALYRDA